MSNKGIKINLSDLTPEQLLALVKAGILIIDANPKEEKKPAKIEPKEQKSKTVDDNVIEFSHKGNNFKYNKKTGILTLLKGAKIKAVINSEAYNPPKDLLYARQTYLIVRGEYGTTTKDFEFKSKSACACFITARSVSGPVYFKGSRIENIDAPSQGVTITPPTPSKQPVTTLFNLLDPQLQHLIVTLQYKLKETFKSRLVYEDTETIVSFKLRDDTRRRFYIIKKDGVVQISIYNPRSDIKDQYDFKLSKIEFYKQETLKAFGIKPSQTNNRLEELKRKYHYTVMPDEFEEGKFVIKPIEVTDICFIGGREKIVYKIIPTLETKTCYSEDIDSHLFESRTAAQTFIDRGNSVPTRSFFVIRDARGTSYFKGFRIEKIYPTSGPRDREERGHYTKVKVPEYTSSILDACPFFSEKKAIEVRDSIDSTLIVEKHTVYNPYA